MRQIRALPKAKFEKTSSKVPAGAGRLSIACDCSFQHAFTHPVRGRFLYSLLLIWLVTTSQHTYGQHPLLNLLTFSDTLENFAPSGLWWVDSSGTLTARQIWPTKSDDFREFHSLPGNPPPGAAIWAVFHISGVSNDTLHRIWFSSNISDYFRVFHFHNESMDSVAAGALVPHSRLPMPDNFMAVPMQIHGASGQTVLLQFQNLGRNKLAISEVFILRPQDEKLKRTSFSDDNRARDIYYFLFLALAGFLLVIFLIQWVVQGTPALLYYCLYLASCGLYYLHLFENTQFYFRPIFQYAGIAQCHLEILIAFCSYSFYMTFVRLLLELPQYRPVMARYLQLGAMFFLAAIPVMWLIGSLCGILYMANAFVYIRAIFAVSAFTILAGLWIGHREHPLTKFITSGTSLLMLGMVMTLSTEIFGGVLSKNIAGGALGWYTHANGFLKVPVYDFKMGVLLEILIFSLGLAYRQRLMNEEYKTVLSQIEAIPTPDTTTKAAEIAEPLYPFPIETAFIQSAVACVEQNMAHESFNVDKLAKALQINRKLLYQRTKEETGLDPSIFLRTIRLWNAKRMLEDNKAASISEIAYQTGFRHPYYFAKVFKAEFGANPKAFQQQKRS